VAIPQSLAAIDRSRAWAATRHLSARMALARMQASKRSAYVAIRFEEDASGVAFGMFVDGNGNGVRTRDIRTGADWAIEPPTKLSDVFSGVEIALPGEAGDVDGVRLGSTSLLSFSPVGSATPGTIYVRGRDGSQFAVRVLGATGRTRMLQYAPVSRTWVDAF
jgi:hypothetical protein